MKEKSHLTFKETVPFVRQCLLTVLSATRYIGKPLKTRDHRLFYIVRGSGEIVISGQSYPIKPGALILFQSNTEYVWNAFDMQYITVNFDYTQTNSHIKSTFSPLNADKFKPSDAFENIFFEDALTLNSPLVVYDAFSMEEKMMPLAIETKIQNVFQEEFLSTWLKFLLFTTLRLHHQQQTVVDKKGALLTREVIAFVHANFNTPINNEDIAKHFHFNSSYLNRIFKAHAGTSLHRFLLDYRLKVALELLSLQNMPVNEVTYAVGFSDVPHFIKTFQKHMGYTPGKIQSQNHTINKK